MTNPSLIFYYFILTYNLHLNSCEYIVIITKFHDIVLDLNMTYKELTHASQHFHNISMYTLYLVTM